MTTPTKRGTGIGAGRFPWIVGLLALAALPYLAALDQPLLRDDRTLLDNEWLIDQASVVNVFQHHYWHGSRHDRSDLYRPLTILTLAWNLRGAAGAAGLRVVNVLLHALACVLVWWVLRCVFGGSIREREVADRVAWTAAAWFAVHPLASEGVWFVTGRAELLAASCGLLAFGCLVDPRLARRETAAVVCSTVAFALALGFKESAASWIAILGLWYLVLRATARPARVVVRTLVAWGVVLGLFLFVRASAVGWLPHEPPWIDNPLVRVGAPTRVANAVLIGGLYLARMALPLRLSVEYGYDQIGVVPLLPWGGIAAACAVVAWCALAATLYRRSPVAAFVWAFVPASFAVTGNVAFPIGTMFAERLAYLPLVGFCGLAAWFVWRLPVTRFTVWALVVLVLVAGAARGFARTRDFRDVDTFHQATALASPRAVKALANLGRTRLRQGRLDEAVAVLERAVAIWPDYSGALSLLADVHARAGDPAAEAYYRRRAREAYARWRSGEDAPSF
ncbi:MAG TPA: tetratricopeptide repeat protein [Candidatus Polarisedimenticolaceae bacterium]|nr:tetratricopeptide repeat protein [Candidatus Polarisedimenticolaceae bacterium]